MSPGDLREQVRRTLCKGFTADQAAQIIQATIPLSIGAGRAVMREGDNPSGLFVLLRGTVEVLKQAADGHRQPLARIDAPTVLGEMSLITARPHSATVEAVTDCEFALLTRAQFQRLLDAESLAAYKLIATIAEVLAGRVVRLDQKVLELPAAKESAPAVEELAACKQKLFSEWSF